MLFGGASIVMTLFGIFFIFVSSIVGRRHMNWQEIGDVMPAYRFMLFCIYLVFATGFASSIYTKYEINYLYIFQIDPHHKMTSWQLYKVSCILYFIFISCFTLNMLEIKMDYVFGNQSFPLFVVVLIIVLVIYCVQPFMRCGYRTARY